MKKGLLTLLAASLVFVGCQNYDDQFDDLNAQISALKSQVDGLASLSSQVSSISGSISGLQAGIAAAQSAAAAAGTEAANATAAATAAGAAATAAANDAAAAAVAAGETASAAAAAAEAAAVAAGATAAEAITAANAAAAAATAAGADAVAAANAAADEAVAAAVQAGADATDAAALATAAAEAATAAAIEAGADAVTAANAASAAAVAAATNATAAATAAGAAATAAGTDAVAAAAAAEAAAVAAADAATAAAVQAGADAVAAAAAAEVAADAAAAEAANATAAAGLNATSLATLAAEVDAVAADLAAVQAALATVSTAEEVAALQTEIDAIEADLEDLLNSSNVYQGGITINSATTLASFNALGNAINIVNGNVSITNVSTYNQTTVQAVINKIFTVNGTYTFVDIADDTDENTASPTFDLLASAGDITMTEVNGAISFASLTTAGEIDITGDSWDHDGDAADADASDPVSAITSFSAPVLANVDAISVGGADRIDISGVGTSININSFTSGADAADEANPVFAISTAAGGTLTAAAMESPANNFALSLTGLASYTNPSGIDAADITVTSIPTVTINDLQGALTVGTGVNTLVATDLYEVDLSGADELVSATLDMTFADSTNADYDEDAAENDKGDGLKNVSVVADNSDLTALTVTGNLMNLSVANSSVVTLTVGATMNNLTVSASDDLTSITVSDASIRDIIINDNDALATLTLDHDQNFAYERDADDAADETDIVLAVTNNDDLTSLTASGGTLNDLDITGNSTLTTVDLSGLSTTGGTTPDFDIYNNDLNAASIVETDGDAGTGTIDSGTSGMETLATLLGNITSDLDATATIRFDSAETISDDEGELNNGNDIAYDADDANAAYLTVLEKTEGTSGDDGVDPGTETQAVGIVPALGDDLAFAVNGVEIVFAESLSGDIATDMAAVLASSGVDTALSAGAIVSATRGYNSSSSVTVSLLTAGTTTLYGERYNTVAAVTAAATETNHGIGAYDQWTLEIGDESVTTSFTTDISTSASLVEAWVAAWDGLLVDLAVNANDDTKIDITAASTALDSTSYDLDIAISVTDSTTASSVSGAAVDYIIGDTRLTTDNATEDEGFIVTFTSTAAGETNNTLASIADGTANSMTTANDYMDFDEAPTDSVEGSDEVAATVTDDGNDTNRTGWL